MALLANANVLSDYMNVKSLVSYHCSKHLDLELSL